MNYENTVISLAVNVLEIARQIQFAFLNYKQSIYVFSTVVVRGFFFFLSKKCLPWIDLSESIIMSNLSVTSLINQNQSGCSSVDNKILLFIEKLIIIYYLNHFEIFSSSTNRTINSSIEISLSFE